MQFVALIFASAASLAWWGEYEARSVFLGGIAGFLPNFLFACRVSRSKLKAPKQFLNSFYAGESLKLISTAALFYFILRLPDVRIVPLFVGFMAVIAVFWFALLLDDSK